MDLELVSEKMKNKFLISINKLSDIEVYKKVGVTTFLLPLQNFAVGYENSFNIEEINKYGKDNYCLVNRMLDCKGIDELKNVILQLKTIKGIIFEDIGVYELIKELGLNIETIYFPNHFNTNYESINYFLNKGISSAFISNELTKEEIKDILNNANKELIVHVFGYNQAMYSRRLLLSNFNSYYDLPNNRMTDIKEVHSGHEFKVVENDSGTVLYNGVIFDGRELLHLNNVKYFYINSSFIEQNVILDFLTGNEIANSNNGFLDKETIFKLRSETL